AEVGARGDVLDLRQELSHGTAGDSKGQAPADHRVYADYTSAHVGQRSPGIARIQLDIGLDDFQARQAPAAPWIARSAGWVVAFRGLRRLDNEVGVSGRARGHHAQGQRVEAPEGVADREHQL